MKDQQTVHETRFRDYLYSNSEEKNNRNTTDRTFLVLKFFVT